MNTDGDERTATKAVLAPVVDEIVRNRTLVRHMDKDERKALRGWK